MRGRDSSAFGEECVPSSHIAVVFSLSLSRAAESTRGDAPQCRRLFSHLCRAPHTPQKTPTANSSTQRQRLLVQRPCTALLTCAFSRSPHVLHSLYLFSIFSPSPSASTHTHTMAPPALTQPDTRATPFTVTSRRAKDTKHASNSLHNFFH